VILPCLAGLRFGTFDSGRPYILHVSAFGPDNQALRCVVFFYFPPESPRAAPQYFFPPFLRYSQFPDVMVDDAFLRRAPFFRRSSYDRDPPLPFEDSLPLPLSPSLYSLFGRPPPGFWRRAFIFIAHWSGSERTSLLYLSCPFPCFSLP